jgi:hypothetical protein
MKEDVNDDDEDFIPFACERWKVGDDYWDSVDEDDDSNYDLNEHIEQRVIVKGRSKKYHPMRDFSDVSEINEINISSRVQLDNPLSENQTFNSNEHLQWTINEYHIRGNIEIKIERSNKSMLVMIRKDQNCLWRLYVVCSMGSPFWIIKTNPYEHTCVQDITRSDHTQLTAKMIA